MATIYSMDVFREKRKPDERDMHELEAETNNRALLAIWPNHFQAKPKRGKSRVRLVMPCCPLTLGLR